MPTLPIIFRMLPETLIFLFGLFFVIRLNDLIINRIFIYL